MGRKAKTFKRGNKKITAKEIMEKTKMSHGAAHHRLKKWEEGKIEWDDLFKPVRTYESIKYR